MICIALTHENTPKGCPPPVYIIRPKETVFELLQRITETEKAQGREMKTWFGATIEFGQMSGPVLNLGGHL